MDLLLGLIGPHGGPGAYGGEMKPTRSAAPRRYLSGSPFNVPVVEEPAETYEPRDLVTHDKYGLGSVLEFDHPSYVLVDFGSSRVSVALPCVKLFKL